MSDLTFTVDDISILRITRDVSNLQIELQEERSKNAALIEENNQLKTQLEKHLEAQCQEESIPQPEEPHDL